MNVDYLDVNKNPPPLNVFILICIREETGEGFATESEGQIVWYLSRRPGMPLTFPPRCWARMPDAPHVSKFPYKD